MSGVWEEAEELYNYGLDGGPDKNVCSAHIDEPAIRSFISRNGVRGVCDYCGKTRNVVELEELMKFLMDTVMYFYTDPVEFASYNSAEGGFLVDQFETMVILQEHFELDIDDNVLYDDIESWVDPFRIWADRKGMYSEGHHERPDIWTQFCHLVKHEVRYLFQNYKDDYSSTNITPFKILREAEKMIGKYHLVTTVPSRTKLFRCRQHSKEEQVISASQICSPQIKYCKSPNRMSPAGISMFYCAFDELTTLKETLNKDWKGSKYTTANFALKEELTVIDLSKLPSVPSYFDRNKRRRYEDTFFLRHFVNDLTKPIERDEKVHIDYVPTQIVTEFFRYMGKGKIDGIIYPSSRNPGYTAMVLFYDHYESLRNLEFLPETLKTKTVTSYFKHMGT